MARVAWYRLRGYEIMADDETVENRRDTCNHCPYLDGDQCGVCGCLIFAKVLLNPERCPKHYWPRVLRKRKKS